MRENDEGWKSFGEPKIKHTIRTISRVTDRPAIRIIIIVRIITRDRD